MLQNMLHQKTLHRFITNKKEISRNISNIKMQNFAKCIKQIAANTPNPSNLTEIINFLYHKCAYVQYIAYPWLLKELTKTHNTMHEAIFEISLRKSITQDFRKSIFDIPFFAMRV